MKVYLCSVLAVLAVAACSPGEQRVSSNIQELTVLDEQINDYRGIELVTLSQLPGRVRVSADSEFGAHGRFVQADMSPNGEYIALTTVGAAHAAAWVYSTDTDEVWPAAFQYGGDLTLGSWHPDSSYLVINHQPPSGGSGLSIVDIASLGNMVEDANQMVRVPQHDELAPEQHDYNALDWEDGELRFTMAGERWRYHPAEGVSED